MNNFPSDPETGVCLSGGLASLSRQPGVRSQTDRPGYSDPGTDTREEGNIGSIITMLITDQVRKYDRCLSVLSVDIDTITVSFSFNTKCKQFDSKFSIWKVYKVQDIEDINFYYSLQWTL